MGGVNGQATLNYKAKTKLDDNYNKYYTIRRSFKENNSKMNVFLLV